MPNLSAYLRATHPLPAAAVTVMGGVLIGAFGGSAREVAVGLLCTGAGQASVGWSNDYLDRELDRRAGRREKPVVAGEVEAAALCAAAIVAFGVCVASGLLLGPAAALAMTAAVVSAWGYNGGLKATWLSWLPYAVSFALLPVFAGAAAGDLPPAWIPAGGSILGVAAHLMNVLPDLEHDRGMRGLPHRLGVRGSLVLAAALLGIALVLAVLATRAWEGPGGRVAAAIGTGLVAAAVAAPARGRLRAGFSLSIAAAAAEVAIVVLSAGRW